MPADLAALESALATGSVEAWLAEMGDEEVRAQVRRALEVDRRPTSRRRGRPGGRSSSTR